MDPTDGSYCPLFDEAMPAHATCGGTHRNQHWHFVEGSSGTYQIVYDPATRERVLDTTPWQVTA